MSSEFIEIEEKTIDEAIEKACQTFGVPREKLNIEIISGESGGFLGLFSKKAKIRASLLALDIDFSFSDKPKEKTDKPREKNEPRSKADHYREKSEAKVLPKRKPEKEVKEISEEKSPVKKEREAFIPNSPLSLKAQELLEGILQRISPEYK
ncbi:MAG TPA: Jag N-terminal domain-containing protein, partial [Smithella sp.]|nr:Jag N-terminal domain-containing protein [Smithella sp.]